MENNINILLSKLGLTETEINKFISNEIETNQVFTKVSDNLRKAFEVDETFVSKMKKEAEKSVWSEASGKLRTKFNLTADEIKEKGYEDILELANKKAIKLKDATYEELLSKNNELSKEIDVFKTVKMPDLEKQYKNEINNFRKNIFIERELEKLDLITPSNVAFNAIQNIVYNKYDVVFDEEMSKIEFRNKQNGMPIRNMESTRELTPQEILKNELEPLNLIKKSNAPSNNPKQNDVKTPVQIQNNPQSNGRVLIGLEKAQRLAESYK